MEDVDSLEDLKEYRKELERIKKLKEEIRELEEDEEEEVNPPDEGDRLRTKGTHDRVDPHNPQPKPDRWFICENDDEPNFEAPDDGVTLKDRLSR